MGTCELDPASGWSVTCVSANVQGTTVGGMSWDPMGGFPDPFCQLSINNSSVGRTSTEMNNLMPMWNQSISGNVGVPMSTFSMPTWRISVFDDDTTTMQVICSVSTIPDTAFSGGDVELGPVQQCASLKVRLQCQP
jgi:hypothetical protein